MKNIGCALAAAVLAVAPVASGAAEVVVSGGEIVPGVWNSRFNAAKQYADANNLPLVIFYGKSDCSYCNKLKKTFTTDEFLSWQNEKKYVLVLSIKYSAPDWDDAREFISSVLRSDDLPKIGVYWKTADGKVVKKGFVGRSTMMPSSVKGELQTKFIDSIEGILAEGGTTPSGGGDTPTPQPVKPSAAEFFNSAKTTLFAIFDDAGAFAGQVQVKTGKANTRTHKARISATAQLLDSTSTVRFGTKQFDVTTATTYDLTSRSGSLTLAVDGSNLVGAFTSAGKTYQLVTGVKIGGNMPTANSVFALQDPPKAYRDYEIFTEWLPVNQGFSSGSRWAFPKKGTAKYDRKTGAFINTGAETNASGLKLTYTASTGAFKGTFLIYYKSSATRLGKLTAKVSGYVVDGVGYGVATVRSFGTFDVLITAP
ncbi:MAG: thioredoxin family protein [Kiritimatiellae bacterium]|nr:thioredoxin family protein [Kiritimatiellia bacterium]